MHLTIIDNVLTHCTLQAGEHTVVLPAFDCIADDAFADIPEGQLQHLDISAVRAFDLPTQAALRGGFFAVRAQGGGDDL